MDRPIAEQDKIDAFCRELAAVLRQITGYDKDEDKPDTVSSRVKATPVHHSTPKSGAKK